MAECTVCGRCNPVPPFRECVFSRLAKQIPLDCLRCKTARKKLCDDCDDCGGGCRNKDLPLLEPT